MFWGLLMEPMRRYTQKVKQPLHISMAVLDIFSDDDEPTQLMLVFEERNHLLCTLQKGQSVQCSLDLNFEAGDEITFTTNGHSNVHLSGYLQEDLKVGEGQTVKSGKMVWVMSSPETNRPTMDAENENASGSGTQRKSTLPKKICRPFVQDFDAIIGTATFVDKSLFIKAFLEADEDGIVVLAPRRFGKSTNMNMVQHFVSGNVELFKGLKIYEEERKFFDDNCKANDPNPVLYVDFKVVGGKTYDEILGTLKEAIGRAYGDNEDLVTQNCKGNWIWTENTTKTRGITAEKFAHYLENREKLSENDVIFGLERLSKCLKLHYDKPVYVFIDEYDHPIMQLIMYNLSKNEVVTETIELISSMMSNLLKGNKYVKKALLNACTRVADVFSPNNIVHFDFLSVRSFAPYFGFTEREVNDLFERNEFVTLKNDKIQKWYNGYKLVHKEKEYVIYSTFSILNYLQESIEAGKPTFKNYWVNSGYITNLSELFAETNIRTHIENLINGAEVTIQAVDKINEEHIFALKSLIHNEPDPATAVFFLQFLAQNGYLNVFKCSGQYITLKVPNEELRRALEREFYSANFFQTKYGLNAQSIAAYQNALCAVLEGRDDIVFLSFAKALSELFIGAEMPQNEDEFHCILHTFAYNLKKLGGRSELITRRKGRLDILVVWHDIGLIIELKFKSKSSQSAHKQIIKKRSYRVFEDEKYKKVTKTILLGVHIAEDAEVSVTRSFSTDYSATKTFTSKDLI